MDHMRRVRIVTALIGVFLVWATMIPADMSTGMSIPASCLLSDRQVRYTYTSSLPETLLSTPDLDRRKMLLVETLLPLILKSNERVMVQRRMVEQISRSLPTLTETQEETLDMLARMYRVQGLSRQETVRELLVRVDVLPPSLILAQAAVESGWGTSRFSREGNNLFGLRTPTGNGMVPSRRPSEETYAVSCFDDLQSCVDYYLWTINTNPLYEDLRRVRSRSEPPYDACSLAQGLMCYSEQGPEYVNKLEKVMSANSLLAYDCYRLR